VVGCDEWNAVAVGDVNGHVIIYSVFDWSISSQFDVGGSIVCMKIIKYKSAIIMATRYSMSLIRLNQCRYLSAHSVEYCHKHCQKIT
jgi:hypothetical protein